MTFTTHLLNELSSKHLLKHPFYQAWNCGHLSKETLQLYAKQYYHHVAAFPRYISLTHGNCEDLPTRQVLLDNLVDEERGEKNHPELWMRFAEGVGNNREAVKAEKLLPQTQELISTFMTFARSSYAEGLGALFAYENQVPEVAASKIEGLCKFYGVNDERSLEFFNVHLKADVYHTQAVSELLEKLSPEEKQKAEQAAKKAAEALWGFLDGIQAAA